MSNILSKLEVQDRTQAVIYAFQHNLIQLKAPYKEVKNDYLIRRFSLKVFFSIAIYLYQIYL